jgi:hypothetical protein
MGFCENSHRTDCEGILNIIYVFAYAYTYTRFSNYDAMNVLVRVR